MAKNTKGLPPLQIGLLTSEEQKQAIFAERVKEEDRRMVALAEQMDIPEGPYRWYFLALELARQHVPELMPLKKDGRPRTWGDFELGVLVAEVEREQAKTDPPMPILEATKALARRSPWKDLLHPWTPGTAHSSDPGEALRQQYKEGRKIKFAKLVRHAYKLHEAHGELDKWDELVGMVRKET
jgi:hypothetical protein